MQLVYISSSFSRTLCHSSPWTLLDPITKMSTCSGIVPTALIREGSLFRDHFVHTALRKYLSLQVPINFRISAPDHEHNPFHKKVGTSGAQKLQKCVEWVLQAACCPGERVGVNCRGTWKRFWYGSTSVEKMAEKTLIQLDIGGKDSDVAWHQWKRFWCGSTSMEKMGEKTLIRLYQWQGRLGEAVSQAEAGLIVIPRASIGVPGPRVFYCIDQ